MEEVWKDIPGYSGRYQASNMGRVKSLDYRHTGNEQIRKPGKNGCGYLTVDLWLNGKSKVYLVHRLIWETFNGPIPDGMQCNHINEIKTDNRLENINLLTCSQNNLWGTKTKRMVNNRTGSNKKKTVYQFDLNGNFIREWESAREIKRQLGYSYGNINSCCRGEHDCNYGYKWSYKLNN